MLTFKSAPMGWNSWDCYGASVDEKTVRQNAEFMAKYLKQYGWEYMVIDIQWSEPNADTNEYHNFTNLNIDEYGRLMPAVNRFPSAADGRGFTSLAEYIHSLGLKFGIHIMRGIPREAVFRDCPVLGPTHTTARQIAKTNSICAWNTDMYGVDPNKPGASEYYDSIFALYASWGVDFIKCDDICRELPHEESELIMLSDSLKNCGRDMVLSLSPGPALLEKAELYKQVSNMWRITDDFWDEWKLLYNMFERAEKWCTHTSYGNYPDADMLPIGPIRQCYNPDNVTKFTKDEQITMMTLWCIFRAPLMIGGEMTKFDDFTMSLITNEALLKMHRDARHSHQVWRKAVNELETALWTAVTNDGKQYVAIFNLSDLDNEVSLSLNDLELDKSLSGKDIWTGSDVVLNEGASFIVKSHGAVAMVLN